MTFSIHCLTSRAAYTVFFGAALAACGGTTPEQNPTSISMDGSRQMSVATYIPQSRGTTTNTGTNGGTVSAGAITNVRFESTTAAAQSNVPVTFGQVFAVGDLSTSSSLVGKLDDGTTVPLQLDVKAKHPDGSVRHAVISAVLPKLGAGEVRTMSLIRSTAVAATASTVAALLNAGFTSSVSATIGGVRYTASADQLLKSGKATVWLDGAQANEWQVSAPLVNSNGVQHPHLTARFAIRWYQAAKKARVDLALENNWAYEPNRQNFTYNVDFTVGGRTAYAKADLVHRSESRWRKLGWWGTTTPEVNIKHNTGYLIATRALPNYDQTLSIPESTLNALASTWTGEVMEPMNFGASGAYMYTTGGRPDLGLLPSWSATYLLSMDKRARDVMLRTADLAGSYSIHRRDKQTGNPISVKDYPYMTILGNPGDTYNYATKKHESFPACAAPGLCDTPSSADTAHQPNFAYLPYLVTGDYYYLEELQFWTMYNAYVDNPYYRLFDKGLVAPDQVRGQAWSLRTLAEATYITPDSHPLKSHFAHFLDSNLDWYIDTYITNPTTRNNLGVITNGYAIVYDGGTGLAPWQDDFFTAAVGHTAELGFAKAANLLRWKTKFVTDRLVGQGSCWIFSANYTMKVRDTSNSPIYNSYADVFKASFPQYANMACNTPEMMKSLGFKVGEIFGFASETIGYPANMQPAVAYAADINAVDGKKAWAQFEQRTVKPNYATSPQFAIKPR